MNPPLALPILGRAPKSSGRKHLTDWEARIVEALADTVFPEDGAMPTGAASAGVVEWVDAYLDRLPADKRMLIRCMFMLYELDFAVFNPGRSSLFSSASAAERLRCLEAWDTSSLYVRRSAFQALKGTLLFAYLRSPEVHRDMGLKRGEVALKELMRKARAAADTPDAGTED